MTKIEKDSLIQKIENLEPDWQTGKYCENNCAQCDGFKKAKEKIIKIVRYLKP